MPTEGGEGGDGGDGGGMGCDDCGSTWSIFAVDVGQGDATVVLGPLVDGRRRSLVIDAGDRHPDGGAIVDALLLEQGVDALDWVVLSHFDGDHVGGFVTVSSSSALLWSDDACTPSRWFPTMGVFDQGTDGNGTSSSEQWTRCTSFLAAELDVPHAAVVGGDVIATDLDLGGGVVATFVAGDGYVLDRAERVPSVNTPNERSIALWIHDAEGFDFLVTGDLTGQAAGAENARVEEAVAAALVGRGVDLEVLRVGHHGAANATEAGFVAALQPEVAVISVGDDQPSNYQHPRCATYQSLAEASVELVVQTERGYPDCGALPLEPEVLDGTVRIDVTGASYVVSNHGATSPAHGGPTAAFSRPCDLTGC